MSHRNAKNVIARLFEGLCAGATLLSVAFLVVLLGSVFFYGWNRLDWDFLTHIASPRADTAGVKAALIGSLWLIGLTTLFSVPIGVGAAIYLEEYARASWWRTIVQTNIANLAGVPSIVYGILGLGLFVRSLALGRSVLAGALTLSLVVLPIIIMAAQESLRAVPPSLRHASFALGASRWQTIRLQVLPAAMPGIMTGVILSISRALGEAAPLLVVGAAAFANFVPVGVLDDFSALPVQIYSWTSRPQAEFHYVAAAGIVVLLVVLLCMNAVAILIRYRFSKHIRW